MSVQFGEEYSRQRSRVARMEIIFEGGTALAAAKTGERVARQTVAAFDLMGWDEAKGGALRTVRQFHSEVTYLKGIKALRRQTNA